MNAELNATIETARLLLTISKICYGLAIVTLLLAVFLWFGLKIKDVIGDLSGYTARKAIEKMRNDSSKNVKKAPKKEPVKIHNRSKSKSEELFDSQELDTGLLDGPSQMDAEDDRTTSLLEPIEPVVPSGTPAREPRRSAYSGNGHAIKLLEEIMLIHTEETIG